MESFHGSHNVLVLLAIAAFVLIPGISLAAEDLDSFALDPQLEGTVYESGEIDRAEAEALFASVEAAIYFPDLRRARWIDTRASLRVRGLSPASFAALKNLDEFRFELERDFPSFRSNRFGPYLLKLPARSTPLPVKEAGASSIAPDATVFTDSFESGISQWQLANNTNGEYNFTAMGCEARTGIWSADPVRGGTRGMNSSCSDTYPASVTTQITKGTCDAIQGASQAWLDFYLKANMDDSEAIGVYYLAADGYIYGYVFIGSWSQWFHVVVNLKQWNHLGDLTTASCTRATFQFRSDATNTAGTGAFIDDVTIRTEAPSFLRATITASPSSGSAPLTVNFAPNVSGASGSEAYEWRFGDASGSTSTNRNATFTYMAAGDYWARLRVADGATLSYAHVKIEVAPGSTCSVSCSASAPSTGAAGTLLSFQATATPSGCSGSPTFLWNFGDGQTSTQQNPTHAYASAGTYSWNVTASVSGTSCPKSGMIVVSAPTSGGMAKRRSVAPPSDTTVASQAVGPAGGTVSGGGVSVTVPAGAFGSSATISITRSAASRASGDLSPTFYVQGLPSTLGADLSLSVDLDTAPPDLGSGESVYVSFGGLAMNRDLSVRSLPFLIPATVSGRNVKATLPKSWGSPALASANGGRVVSQAYTGDFRHELKVVPKTSLSSDHFNIYFPSAYVSAAQISLSTLEEAYQRLTALGFSWGCRQASGGFVKVPVYLASLGTGEKDPIGEQNSRLDPCGTGWVFTDFIRLNTDYAAGGTPMRGAIGHELFHFLQEMYIPTTVTNPSRALWIAEASAVWFETIFVPGSCPGVMTGSYQFAWRGLFNPSTSAVEGSGRRKLQNHGYGAAAVIKYRTDASSAQNDPFVKSIWDSLKAGNGELDAFQNAVGASVPDFWTRFSKDYFTGVAGCSAWAAAQTATMKDAASLLQTFNFDAYPLSSISHIFNLMQLAITDKTPLSITAQNLMDGQTVFIYDMKTDKEIGQLTEASNTYAIEDITTFKGHILVLTFVDANLPAGSSASTNEVTITTGGTYKCAAAAMVFSVNTPVKGTTGWTSCAPASGSGSVCSIYDGDYFIGSVIGDKFHSEAMYCPDPPAYCRWTDFATYSHRVDFTFTNKGATIEGFDLATQWTPRQNPPQGESLSVTVPVPRVASSAAGFQYKLTGPSVCSSAKVGSGAFDMVCNSTSFFVLSCEAYQPK